MLKGINLNTELKNKDSLNVSGIVTNPISTPYKNLDKSLLIDESAISDQAVKLYQKEQDIKNFTSIAMSDSKDLSHEEIVSALFKKGVVDPFDENILSSLADNKKLLNDLTL